LESSDESEAVHPPDPGKIDDRKVTSEVYILPPLPGYPAVTHYVVLVYHVVYMEGSRCDTRMLAIYKHLLTNTKDILHLHISFNITGWKSHNAVFLR
jgi:hypothetical protein